MSEESAADLAVFTALTAGVTLGTVYQDVPEGTQPPVVILADLQTETPATKGNRTWEMLMLITTEVWESDRRPILLLQGEVKAALDGKTLTADGYAVQCAFERAETRQVDAKTYFGTQFFKLYVSAA